MHSPLERAELAVKAAVSAGVPGGHHAGPRLARSVCEAVGLGRPFVCPYCVPGTMPRGPGQAPQALLAGMTQLPHTVILGSRGESPSALLSDTNASPSLSVAYEPGKESLALSTSLGAAQGPGQRAASGAQLKEARPLWSFFSRPRPPARLGFVPSLPCKTVLQGEDVCSLSIDEDMSFREVT